MTSDKVRAILRRGRFQRGPALLLVLALLPACLACNGAGGHRGETYTVRGKVTQLPVAGNPASGFQVYHEAIDRFRGRDGEVTGMDPMSMPFLLAKEVSLQGIQVGDPIEFTLEVDWKAEPPVQITDLHKLPANTKLVYRAADPNR